MPRPRIADPRIHQLNLHFTTNELASIRARAETLGMRLPYLGRALLLSEPVKVENREGDDLIHRAIIVQLQRLGNNLNQMVRHLHQTGDPVPIDLEPLLADIRAVIERTVRS